MSDPNPDSVGDLIRAAVAFRDQRDWAQFHSPKELAISLAVLVALRGRWFPTA